MMIDWLSLGRTGAHGCVSCENMMSALEQHFKLALESVERDRGYIVTKGVTGAEHMSKHIEHNVQRY